MNLRKRLLLSISAVFLLLDALSIAWAQGLTGSIVGTITDPANAVVPKAKVTVKNANTNAEVSTTSDNNGIYRVLGLVPGEYTVTAEATGFRRITTSPQTVDVSTPVRVDLKMEVGAVTETISVETRATQENTEDA